MSVCLSQDSELATEIAERLMPAGDELSLLDFNDPQVFGAYYDLWFRQLVRYVQSLIRVDVAQAEDIVQEVSLKAWQWTFFPMQWRQFRAWMYRAVFHVVQQHMQLRPMEETVLSLEVLRQQEENGQPYQGPQPVLPVSVEEQIEQRELLAEVVQAVEQMSPTEQLALRLGMQDYSPAEMAEQLRRGHAWEGQIANPTRYVYLVRQRLSERVHRGKQPRWAVGRRYRKGVAKGAVNGWSPERGCCQQCGTTTYPYQGKGLCQRCYGRGRSSWEGKGVCRQCGTTEHAYKGKGLCTWCARKQREAKVQRQPRWAVRFDACVVCGTTTYAHQAQGKCKQCYNREFRAREGRGA